MGLFGGGSGADWLIAGLGNPEPKYDGTRHNAGFEALDYLAAQWGCSITKAKWQGLYGTAQVGQHKVVLLKPLTYMNLSGQSIAPAAKLSRYGSAGTISPAARIVRIAPIGSTIPESTPPKNAFGFPVPSARSGMEIIAPSGKF